MCGITGGIADRDITPVLLDGLRRLEYRGYDSAGICVLSKQVFDRIRVCGKVKALEAELHRHPVSGHLGIAHTRWATHGKPSTENAHPHYSEHVAIVHNGIIENFQPLKESLQAKGVNFESDTDTEVIAHLLEDGLKSHSDFLSCLQSVTRTLQGAYALAMMHQPDPDHLWVARFGSPLVIGLGDGENYVASDMLALLPVTQRFIILEEGDIAKVSKHEVTIYDLHGHEVNREFKDVLLSAQTSEKGKFRHYMQKEIFEQPKAIQETLKGRLLDGGIDAAMLGENTDKVLASIKQVHMVACGTSYHAAMVAQYWFESLLRIPVRVEIASEMRHQEQVASPDTLFVVISQSGETADTLAALRSIKQNPNYRASLCICNVDQSSLAREADMVFLTHAGPEIGVCSTKAFTTQLVALLLLAANLGKAHNIESPRLTQALHALDNLIEKIQTSLGLDATIERLAETFADKQHALFLGRGFLYPIAKEGALKLKEISYIHAESYPAGELKHGPLALVDKDMPVVALACQDHLLDKLRSNLQEVKARHGQVIVFATADTCLQQEDVGLVIELPPIEPELAPILLSIPMQLLAYHVALIKGTDVDQPRNLAKSVTVE